MHDKLPLQQQSVLHQATVQLKKRQRVSQWVNICLTIPCSDSHRVGRPSVFPEVRHYRNPEIHRVWPHVLKIFINVSG